MPTVLLDRLARAQLPEPRRMVATRTDQVRRVRAEGHIPDPPLMPRERLVERDGVGRGRRGGQPRGDVPELDRLVRPARREVLGVGREQAPQEVLLVREELGAWFQRRDGRARGGGHRPDVDVALERQSQHLRRSVSM